tara:strand:- start:32 stop:196 length:165 start_codon:yes stop_codon:yes gene_type:complete
MEHVESNAKRQPHAKASCTLQQAAGVAMALLCGIDCRCGNKLRAPKKYASRGIE